MDQSEVDRRGLVEPHSETPERGDDMPARKSSGSGNRGRSAISGRFVKQSTVRKNPKTTVNESASKKKK